ncbi:unnamed protein product, partial [Mesorhabditis spiculigera]
MKNTNVPVLKKIPKNAFEELKSANDWDPERVKHEWKLEYQRQVYKKDAKAKAKLKPATRPVFRGRGAQRQEMLLPYYEKARRMSSLTTQDRRALEAQTGLKWEQNRRLTSNGTIRRTTIVEVTSLLSLKNVESNSRANLCQRQPENPSRNPGGDEQEI